MRGFASVAAAVLLAGTVHLVPVHAQSVTAGDLVVSKAWSRATPGGAKVAAGFLTIENKGSAPDKLVSASTPLADHAEIHEMKMANGVMSMREISGGLTIPAGQSVTLAPGGYHLMLMGPKQPFKQGEKVPLTLTFGEAVGYAWWHPGVVLAAMSLITAVSAFFAGRRTEPIEAA